MRRIFFPILFTILSLFLFFSCKEDLDEINSPPLNFSVNKEITTSYDPSLAVKCKNGVFVGIEEDGVLSFKGIAYAKPPVGDLRWKRAQKAEDSDNVYEAYYFGPAPIEKILPSDPYYPRSEDCLTLNIWTKNNDIKDKTVMVFIHGGSYAHGATSRPIYDGFNLAKNFDDIIIVTIEYRLGIMGFLDLSSFEGGEEYKESGNLGLLDQVEAMRWINENIEAFGGDKGNITVFGESAGGGSVSLLPLIEGTEDLFHRIIIESGPVSLTSSQDEHENLASRLKEKSGKTSISELLMLTEDELITLSEELDGYTCFPLRDGVILPLDLYGAYEDERLKNIDMMIGTNKDEVRYWINGMGICAISDLAMYRLALPVLYENTLKSLSEADKARAEAFIENRNVKKIWQLTEFFNEMLFRLPSIKMAESHANNGGKTYMYYFCYPGEDVLLGSCHELELAYVFSNLDALSLVGSSANPELSEMVQRMWVNFAKTGDPSIDEIMWDEYEEESRLTLYIDRESKMVSDPLSSQRELLSPLLKYGINGRTADLSLNVPQVYKILALLLAVVAILVLIVIVIIKLIIRRRNNFFD